ncbi:hypothetical protein TRFO_06406 [Tritrichomonas foetus]|uniref:BAR domain-containing protein n=1 Tax=Tritrichomonas foetus TaxID=1144522 RepID=A0A1J4JZJ9_9EUKA|nr:hypothetical protein TRFO_06406 [Tritrichomonas foetus]|eukprot:OHT04106.1 hypothetical protein TRFO_06406 [Tritrichomonas foetus]
MKGFSKFPEYTSMNTHLNNACNTMLKYCTVGAEANNRLFTEFANGQPPEVCKSLKEAQKHSLDRNQVIMGRVELLRELKQGLQQIQPLNASQRERIKNLTNLQSQKRKCESSYLSASAKNEKAKIKNPSSVDAQKAKNALDRAEHQRNCANRDLEQYTEKFAIEDKKYKKDIFSCMLNILITFSTKYTQNLAKEIPVCNEIAEAGEKIPDYEDTGIPQLEDEIETLSASLSQQKKE